MELPFADRLATAVRRCGNPVVVGLDPRLEQIPQSLCGRSDDLREIARTYEQFSREVIDAIATLVPAVKPQVAFFEQLGPAGMEALSRVIAYAKRKELLVIVDAKRNDIGSTAEAYADAYLGADEHRPFGGDALTVSPYLGSDSLEPFLQVACSRQAGIFALVKTSNPGSGMFQDLLSDGRPLYRHVAEYVEQQARATIAECGYGTLGAVVGATYREQLAELRSVMQHAWLLVPGYGSQGGTALDVAGAFDEHGLGAVVNNSRGILFAYQRKPYSERFGEREWQRAVEAATRDMIAELRADTAVGRLAV